MNTNTTIQVLIHIDPANAVRVGSGLHGRQLVDVDLSALSQEERDELARCTLDTKNGASYDRNNPQYLFVAEYVGDIQRAAGYSPSVPTQDEVIAILRARITTRTAYTAEQGAKAAEARRLTEERAREWLAAPLDEWVQFNHHTVRYGWRYPGSVYDLDTDHLRRYPGIVERIAEAEALAKTKTEEREALFAAQERAARERKAAEKAEEERKAAAQEAQLNAWVVEHGTPNQKGRHALGLLPRDEVLDAIRAEAYAALHDLPRYEELVPDDIPCLCECDTCDLDFEVEDATEITAEEYETLHKAQAALPDAEITVRYHKGVRETCGAETDRKSIRVAMTVGEFSFSREYACP